jgi:hydroxyacylglutathione hydrolase
MKVIHLDTASLGDRSYIAHDGTSALVVDPQRDIDRVIQILETEGVSLSAVVETHIHNDYVSGGLQLAREFGVKYIVNEADPVAYERYAVKDTDVIDVGNFAIQVLHTPGHTFTHLSYALLNEVGNPVGVFTGGSMLHGSTGRPDLLGAIHAEELAGLQHGSAHRLASFLPDAISIHPTHGFGSFCAATATCGDSSTIADEKRTNPALLLSKEEFIRTTLAGLDAFPAYYKYMGPLNHQGPSMIDLSALSNLQPQQIQQSLSQGAWVVDIRSRNEYVKGHLPGSINAGLDGSFATYLGWIYDYSKDLVLISDSAETIALAQRELVRIGIDKPKGQFVGDITKLETPTKNKSVTFSDVSNILHDENIIVLDVRRLKEHETAHIEGEVNIPLHELESRISELPQGKAIWVHCAGAYRASAALGLLERSGFEAVLINEPFEAALRVANLPIVSSTQSFAPLGSSDTKG